MQHITTNPILILIIIILPKQSSFHTIQIQLKHNTITQRIKIQIKCYLFGRTFHHSHNRLTTIIIHFRCHNLHKIHHLLSLLCRQRINHHRIALSHTYNIRLQTIRRHYHICSHRRILSLLTSRHNIIHQFQHKLILFILSLILSYHNCPNKNNQKQQKQKLFHNKYYLYKFNSANVQLLTKITKCLSNYFINFANKTQKNYTNMKLITLLILLSLLSCTNHKAQNTNSEPQDSTTISSESTNDSQLSTLNFQLSKEILLGKFNPATDSNFVLIPEHMASNKSMYCHRETFQAYLAMRDSALLDGITLTIVSATRNFDRQKQIWDRKWNSFSKDTACRVRNEQNDSNQTSADICKIRSIMRYSSMPGTSRHHWGTDLDFISVEPDYWTHGEGLRIYKWLCANAHKFGFFQPYTADPTRTGYAEERWHWSYAPLSKPYLEAYRQKITPADITGFSGSYLVDSLGIIQSHVFGITE